ncbi:MAG TPA: hypothetical protein PKA64_15400 [Myxococcota bacterium]|nr:hypothetical protein [Myxococcota bacterium]
MDQDALWRKLRWGLAALIGAIALLVLLLSPVRRADVAFDALPIRTLDGVAVDKAWFEGKPGVIHVWLPG